MSSPKQVKPKEINNEAIQLLTPAIDLGKNHCSLQQLNKNAKAIIEKTKLTGEPSVLKLSDGTLAIICDPSTFAGIEQRRQQLVRLLEDIFGKKPFTPRTTKLSQLSAILGPRDNVLEIKRRFARIEGLRHEANWMKCQLYDKEDLLAEAERELKKM